MAIDIGAMLSPIADFLGAIGLIRRASRFEYELRTALRPIRRWLEASLARDRCEWRAREAEELQGAIDRLDALLQSRPEDAIAARPPLLDLVASLRASLHAFECGKLTHSDGYALLADIRARLQQGSRRSR